MIGHHDSRGGILATRTALSHGGGRGLIRGALTG